LISAQVAVSTVQFETLATSVYYGDDTVVQIAESFEPIQSNTNTIDTDRYPSPLSAFVPNMGIYRVDFTGDVTAFSEDGSYTFSLVGTEAHDPVGGDDEYAAILNFKFLKPCKLVFYVNGRAVNGVVRRSDLDFQDPVGAPRCP